MVSWKDLAAAMGVARRLSLLEFLPPVFRPLQTIGLSSDNDKRRANIKDPVATADGHHRALFT